MATTTRHHIEISRIDTSGNLFVLYPKNTLKDVYTSSTSGVTIEGKVNFFGTCDTAANTAAKTVTISGFSLTAGAHLTVVFTNGISVASATLNVNGAGAKAIYFEGAALKANAVRAKARVHMVYDGSYFHVLSGASNAAYVSNANTTKFYLLGTPTNAAGSPGTEYFDTGVYVSTTAGQLVATSFSGNGSALTNLNASNIASGTLAAARLATSGVTAGTYGPTANATLAASGTFTVPKVVTDAYGRVTGASNVTYTLPADNNTDTKVTNNVANTTKFYLVGSTSNSNTTGTLVKDTGVYVSTTAGQLVANTMQANTFYLGGTSASINATDYTGKAATVGTISGYLVDSCESGNANGVTTKALTANQGYLLQNQINTLNSNLNSYSLTTHTHDSRYYLKSEHDRDVTSINENITEISDVLGTINGKIYSLNTVTFHFYFKMQSGWLVSTASNFFFNNNSLTIKSGTIIGERDITTAEINLLSNCLNFSYSCISFMTTNETLINSFNEKIISLVFSVN